MRLVRMLAFSLATLIAGGTLWLGAAPASDAPALVPLAERADRVLVEKAARRLTLFRDGQAIATYRVALGFAPEGDKAEEGDGRTPEGVYRVDRRNDRSRFHLSLGLSYPDAADRAAAAEAGVDPGGDIFIHGQPNGHDGPPIPYDWTLGCLAVSNAEIREIWSRVAIGTEVEIRP